MPIYEYKCPNGHLFEVFQRMTDEPASVCEVCGEGPVERVLHPVAVHYKGSGFYSTDYGKGSGKGPPPRRTRPIRPRPQGPTRRRPRRRTARAPAAPATRSRRPPRS